MLTYNTVEKNKIKSFGNKWVGVEKQRENEGKARRGNKKFEVKEAIRLTHQQRPEWETRKLRHGNRTLNRRQLYPLFIAAIILNNKTPQNSLKTMIY